MAATQPNLKSQRDSRHLPHSDALQEAAEDSRDGVNYGLAARNSTMIEMFYPFSPPVPYSKEFYVQIVFIFSDNVLLRV